MKYYFSIAARSAAAWCYLLFCTSQLAAQFHAKIERLNTEQGLSHRWVRGIAQDRQDYMWFSTEDGLNRYDGHRFVVFQNNPEDACSLGSNQLWEMYLDRKTDGLWIISAYGLEYFDLKTYCSTRYSKFALARRFLNDSVPDIILGLIHHDNGRIFVIGNFGPQQVIFEAVSPDSLRLLPESVGPKTVWGGYTTGPGGELLFWGLDRISVYAVDQESGAMKPYGLGGMPHHKSRFFITPMDQQGKWWYVSDGEWKWFQARPVEYRQKEGYLGCNLTLLDSCMLFRISRDGQLQALDVCKGTLQVLYKNCKGSNLFADCQGVLWIFGQDGLEKVQLNHKLFENYLNIPFDLNTAPPIGFATRHIAEDAAGNYWVMGQNELKMLTPEKRVVEKDAWQNLPIQSVFPDRKGNVWSVVSHIFSDYIKDPATAVLKAKSGGRWDMKFPLKVDFLPETSFYEDNQGLIWIIMADVLLYRPGGTQLEKSGIPKGDFLSTTYNRETDCIYGIRKDENLVVIHCKTQTQQVFRLPFSDLFRSKGEIIVKEIDYLDGEIWIGTTRGAFRFNLASQTLRRYTKKEGLPNDIVYSVLTQRPFVWLGTAEGLCRMDTKTGITRAFYVEDGLSHHEFNSRSRARLSNGMLAMGGLNGINLFYPENLEKARTRVVRIRWDSYSFYQNSTQKNVSRHHTAGDTAETLVFQPFDRQIEFFFSLNSFSDPMHHQFSFRIEGLDNEQRQWDNLASLRFESLRPGDYILHVSGKDEHGNISENELHIPFKILQVWYLRFWAIALYAIALGGVLYLFYHIQHRRNQEKAEAERLKALNESQSRFLTTVSHELRTPLTSILGFSKIIRKRLEEKIWPNTNRSDYKIQRAADQIMDNLDIVVLESERLSVLINEVLDLAKIESGKAVWSRTPFQLAEVLGRAIAATSTLFEQKKLKLVKNIQPDLPNVIGDPDRILQVIVNLLSNAVKFTLEGYVTCTLNRYDDKHLLLSVADTGKGIPKEFQVVIFEKFQQVSSDTLTDKPQGTGLGLTICREIIEHHNGKIWVESEAPKGSTFYFTLPHA